MRTSLATIMFLAACSVPDKQLVDPDASPDAPIIPDGTVDDIAPETIIGNSPAEFSNNAQAAFEFSSDDPTATFRCSIDDDTPLTCSSPYTRALGNGDHVFAVRAVDAAGNPDDTPAEHHWTIDTIAPDTNITAGPAPLDNSTTISPTFTANEDHVTFDCSIDGGAFTTCHSGQMFTGIGDGAHSFSVRAHDRAGNVDSSPALRSWSVDTSMPDTQIETGPTGTTTAKTASFTFISPDAGSGATFQCHLDGAAFTACTSPQNFLNLADGDHTFYVRVKDSANNLDPSPAMRTWTVDTTPPTVSITSGPANGSTVGPRVSLGFTADDGTIACSLDGAPFAACTSPEAFNVAAGGHQFRVQATDAVGNVATVTRSWTTACAAPTTTGAVGLLHLDTAAQVQPNAVAAGADATLGDDMTVEPTDPTALAAARFGGGLGFSGTDHVAWPLAAATSVSPSLVLYAKPDKPMVTTNLATSGDGRVAIRVVPAAGTNIRFSVDLGGIVAVSPAVPAGAWHHVAVTIAQATLRVYVDGQLAETAMTDSMAFALDSLQLGNGFTGALDEIWVATASMATDDAALAGYCPM